ncbi:hypothetical protein LCGC14_1142100 [marine sediment metagenome]|uniref:NTP pyrophosphohydrolase MazG putative catalytic core domain-containing protein n=1 Tax=marine sediment metagenome TaxID=412755 RepID=A0A0F9LY04_9ZZZZ
MYSVTISGSLRKFLDRIRVYIRDFEKNSIKVLSPKISEIQTNKDGFIYFKNDKKKPIDLIEKTHLLNISYSDFLFVVNPNGYIGTSTLIEIGYALALNKKIFSSDLPSDMLLRQFVISGKTIPQIIELLPLKRHKKLSELSPNLNKIQKYIRMKVIEREFDDESENDLFILLLEEIGELATIIRVYSGLKTKETTIQNQKLLNVEEEIADIFIYILIFANKFGINLFKSFISKERKNEDQKWDKSIPK